MSTFPAIMPQSLPIRIGNEYKSPYQWAADLAPDGKLVQYKNAMLWLEGEDFESKDSFLTKVEKIVKYQESESHEPKASSPPPQQPEPKDEDSSGDKQPASEGFTAVATKPKKAAAAAVPWTRQQLAKGIVDGCLRVLDRSFRFAGPSLPISDVYAKFDTKAFTFPQLIGAVRDEIDKLPQPSTRFAVPKSARYNAAGSPGKGKNFNFKVQRKDSSAPNGWSAVAQVHVLWQ
jgi:hypothetical protein